ncbi:MAG: autotransporter-associated beta strand repeat-containing protein, partial [Luteolibacter sp.]
MKPRYLRFFPRTLMFCVAPVLGCASVQASVLNFNEASTTNVWTFRPGLNLLAGATVTASAPLGDHGEGTSTSWAPATDGSLGAEDGGDFGNSVSPANGTSVTYALDISLASGHNITGYDITSFDAYGAWGNTGRDNLDFTIEYSTMADPGTFTPLATVSNHTPFPGSLLDSTHTSLVESAGVLASGVHSIRLNFNNQENNYVGYREFILRADTQLTYANLESNKTNAWTLPAGTNLLKGATATPSTLATREGSSPNWSTVTNGILGAPGDNSSSVTPLNDSSVSFPLNTLVNVNGYNLSSIDTYSAWINSGRDNQDLVISYSKVGAESVFLPLAYPYVHTGSDNSTHIRLFTDTGFLATGVSSIKFSFPNQENGYVGIREFIALGTAVSISAPLTWTGGTGSSWIDGADNNWKQTIGGAPAVYNVGAGLTFDSAPTNRNINVPAPLTAFSMGFTNDASHPYTFGGSLLTVSNEIVSLGSGSATFNNAVKTSTGVSLSDSGSLVFNGALEANSLALSGTGGITLNAANPALTGSSVVSDGTLTVSHNNGLQNSGLSMTGTSSIALFTSAAPVVPSISSLDATPGIVLGNPGGTTNLSVGDAVSVSGFAGSISQAAGTTGALTKTGASSLSLSGDNTYTGKTTVSGGLLQLTQRLSLYHGTETSWTTGNISVASGATLEFGFGDFDQFVSDDLNTHLSLGGFQPGSSLGLNTIYDDLTLSRNLTQPGLGLVKTGPSILNLTGTNTSNGTTRIFLGALNAASPGGTSIGGNALIGNGSGLAYLNMNLGVGNQFAPGSVVTFANGNFYNSTMNLRGTNQIIAGLDAAPFPANKITIVQNDEIGHPGYTVAPGAASLTINAATDHSFAGIIRDQNGGPLSVIKNGPGTQEFINLPGVADYQYSGLTTINDGTLKISFATNNGGFSSNIMVNSPGKLYFNGVTGDVGFDREISGNGLVAVKGSNAVRLRNRFNSFTGGITVGSPGIATYDGFLALVAQGGQAQGAGNGVGQFCVGGAMTQSNVITAQGGATLALDGIGPLGESTVIPAYAPSVVISNSGLRGGGLAFVANLTLNHAEVTVGNGIVIAGFDTSLCFVGTVTVGGDSNLATTIITPTAGPSANISLGSGALPGTTFNVTDVTGTSAVDLDVNAVLRNINSVISPLTKTGAGTMWLHQTNTYTGDTKVEQGELQMSVACLADTANVSITSGATLNLNYTGTDTIRGLTLGGVGMGIGSYGRVGNSSGATPTSLITGDGILQVTASPTVSYDTWNDQITVGDSTRTGDPDGDGFSNLQEYLFGTSPNVANASLSTVQSTPGGLIVRWKQRANVSNKYFLQE